MNKYELERNRGELEFRVANHPYRDCDHKTRLVLRILDLIKEVEKWDE